MAQLLNDPPPYGFWFQIREVEALDHIYEIHANDEGSRHVKWVPPECTEAFNVTKIWPYHIWIPGENDLPNTVIAQDRVQRKEDLPTNIKHHETTSMFFSTELTSFFEFDGDCTAVHVSDRKSSHEDDGWNRISFVQHDNEIYRTRYPNLWMVGHGHPSNQIKRVNITSTWKDLLLPGCFERGTQHKGTPPTATLAGKLTILLGLVGFATVQNNLINMIRDCFCSRGSHYYVPPATGYDRDAAVIPKRGLIIDIAIDTSKCTTEQFEEWEEGKRGPILEDRARGLLPSQIQPHSGRPYQSPVPTQPATQYAGRKPGR